MSTEDAQFGGSSAYTSTMSKWATDAMLAFEAPTWWIRMAISSRVCEPWRDLREFLQAHNKLVKDTGAGALTHLVRGRDLDLIEQCMSLQTLDSWGELLETVQDNHLLDVSALCIEIATASTLAFKLRIINRANAFPALILTLAK